MVNGKPKLFDDFGNYNLYLSNMNRFMKRKSSRNLDLNGIISANIVSPKSS